jgi:hypothetical protein
MTRRRLLLLGVSVAVVVLAGLFVLWLAQRGRQIDRFASERIKVGMTENAVVRIVGMPPGDYRTATAQENRSRFTWGWGRGCAEGCAFEIDKNDQLVCSGKPADMSQLKRTSRQWLTNLQVLYVLFDENGTVTGFTFQSAGNDEDTPVEKLRRWLRL